MQRIGKVLRENLRLLPVALSPYAWALFLIIMPFVIVRVPMAVKVLGIVLLSCEVLVVADAIYCAARKNDGSYASVQNLCVKVLQIPVYIFFFVVGSIGLLMSVWGAWITILAYLVDVVTIFTTGLLSLRSAVQLYKEGRISKIVAVLCSVGGFVFCIDVVVALFLATVSGANSAFLQKYVNPVIKRFNGGVTNEQA